jgi:hypothetical protein
MAERPLAFIIEGKPNIPIQLERNDGFDQTVPTNGDGYALFAVVPESPWDVNIHIHAAGFEPYDHVLSSLIPGGIPAGGHNLFVGQPSHPITPGFDIVLPPLKSSALPRIVAGRFDFFTEHGQRHVIVGSTELMLGWRYDLEGADAIRPVLEQRRALRFNNLRVLWQKGPGSNGLTAPWQMPTAKMRSFLSLLAEYGFYCEGCILADQQSFSDPHVRVDGVRAATAGITNHFEQLGNEYQKNGFEPRDFSRPTDRLATNASAVTGGADAQPYWDYFTFSGERDPAQKAIREYGPIEFIAGAGAWGGLVAICGEGFKPGQTSSDPRAFYAAGAQARSACGGRYHTDAGTAGNCRLFNTLELTCGRAFTEGLLG